MPEFPAIGRTISDPSWKLGQKRPAQDQQGMLRGRLVLNEAGDQELAEILFSRIGHLPVKIIATPGN